MNVIITGSEGFIGKNLQERLGFLLGIGIIENLKVLGIDMKNGEDVNLIDMYANFKPDVIIHLAAEVSVWNPNHEIIVHSNVRGFIAASQYAREIGAKFIYASSSAVIKRTSLYGISKHMNEEYCRIYHPEAIGLRFHNVYGPQQRTSSLFGIIQSKKPFKVFNYGQNTRTFTHVHNVLDAILYYMENDGPPIVSVMSPETSTTLEFVKECENYLYLDYEVVPEEREFDVVEQAIDQNIPVFQKTQYLRIAEGIRESLYSNLDEQN